MAKRDERAGRHQMPSIISSALCLTGHVECDGVVHVDGKIDGDVRCESLTVSETGSVNGHICAIEVEIRGQVKGSVQAKRICVKASARVAGDVTHEMLLVERGAAITGFCRTAENVGVTGSVDIRNSIGTGLRKIAPPLSRRAPAGPGRQRGDAPLAPAAKSEVSSAKQVG